MFCMYVLSVWIQIEGKEGYCKSVNGIQQEGFPITAFIISYNKTMISLGIQKSCYIMYQRHCQGFKQQE